MGQNEKYSEMRKKPMEYRKVFDSASMWDALDNGWKPHMVRS